MKCCVQNCSNDDTNPTNKSNGITFHKLPEHLHNHSAWLKVLSTPGWEPSSRSVVHSQHFKAEDTLPNQQRLKGGAIPIVVCRICLTLDVKMYDMRDFKLGEMFQNITGIMARGQNESILQRVCWECAARLRAAAMFRDKALLSDALLQDLVNITKRDIALIKDNHSTLKSSLIIHNAFITTDIQYKHTPSKNEKVDSVEIDLKERETGIRFNDELEADEPLIDVPIKTEIEFDPISDNNINITVKDKKSDIFLGLSNFNDDSMSSRDIDENLVENNKEPSYKYDMRSSEEMNKITKDPVINDESNIVINDSKVRNVKVDVRIENAEEVSCDLLKEEFSNKAEQNMRDKTGAKIKTTDNRVRFDQSTKEKIIALKQRGFSVAEIAKETGKSPTSISSWWHRYGKTGLKPGRRINKYQDLDYDMKQQIIDLKQQGVSQRRTAYLLGITRNTVKLWWRRWCSEGHVQKHKAGGGGKKKTTPQEDQFLIDKVSQEQSVHTPSLAQELGISVITLRNRLHSAGFRYKEKKAIAPLRSGRRHKVDEQTKQQIINLKQHGVSVTDIANQFRVTRTSVYLWWRRWCKQNNIKIKEQDNSTEHGKDKSTNRPLIISSQMTIWEKLPDIEFISEPGKSDEKVEMIEEKRITSNMI